MLITFENLQKKHRLNITGFIQAGAHYAEELVDFRMICIPDKIHLFEPLKQAYDVIRSKQNGEHVYNVALGAKEGKGEMYVDRENTGQSSSLLEPALHKEQYPNITFPDREMVKIVTLDSYKIKDCNALWMDCQGYELEILKGAVKTLEYIDYIYTEVNVDEVYKGCARLYDMDNFLLQFGFERVELDLSGKTWGDAFYIKKKLIGNNEYVPVPADFQQRIQMAYPPDNDYIFEEWFSDCVCDNRFDNFSGYTYLPVFWTGLYCNNSFGKSPAIIKKLQNYLDSLDIRKKYFTIVQYDDAILNDFRDKNVTVFAMGGYSSCGRNVKIVPLPLMGPPHKWNYDGMRKDIICSFVGRIDTHPIRKRMNDILFNKPDFYFHFNQPLPEYCKIAARSFFMLAPRGYGLTSFRIWEALQYKAVPVYITEDKPFLPEFYNHENKPCMIICSVLEAETKIRQMLRDRHIYNQYVANGETYYEKYFNYDGLAQYILDYLYLNTIHV